MGSARFSLHSSPNIELADKFAKYALAKSVFTMKFHDSAMYNDAAQEFGKIDLFYMYARVDNS